jgi:dipeptidyl aminopeptidase/acylaminoacyl peptidase
MIVRKHFVLASVLSFAFLAACSLAGGREGLSRSEAATTLAGAGASGITIESDPTSTPQSIHTQTPSPTVTVTLTPTATPVVFNVGNELTIDYLRKLEIGGSQITFERELAPTFYYRQYIASYISEGNKIYGLLTVPIMAPPETGFKAIVFNHGYIPPASYRTTERYTAYVDYLARAGFVVFKIDLRGHGDSEGTASGSYYSPGYTIDAVAALKSLQTLDFVDPDGIGMWGHSMAGNLVLRAMLIEPKIKAGVIWAGAVYSYDDLAEYGINDNSYRPPATPEGDAQPRRSQQIFDAYGRPGSGHPYWQAVSLTANLDLLQSPLQIHHAQDDPVVNIGYSQGLAAALQAQGKAYEFYIYPSGGHNLVSPYFDQAMLRTVEFFRNNL